LISVIRNLLRSGPARLFGFIAGVICIAIVAIVIGNRYGATWGGVIAIVIGPLIMVRILRASGLQERNRRERHGRGLGK
jgi:uncharacterized membrane protein